MKSQPQAITLLIFLILASFAVILPARASEPTDKCFTESSGNRVCVGKPTTSNIHFTIDYPNKTIKARTELNFRASSHSAKVFFFLDPIVQKAMLNNKKIKVERRKTPGNENWIIVVPVQNSNKVFKLELEYNISGLTHWGLNWQPFWWLSDYSDSSDARFINAFSPASFEKDRYPMIYTFEFKGLKNPLKLYTSAAKIEKPKKNVFRLKFANWNNIATPYFEFTSLHYNSFSFRYKGKYQVIPVTFYLNPLLGKPLGRSDLSISTEAENMIRMTLDKFESSFGQYPFDKLLVKIYSLQKGDLPLSQEYSMEYGGAVVSRLELVSHEICHQWFARGASPQDGQAGFIDELICDWYDYNNPVKKPNMLRKPVLLSSKDLFTLRTPEESYQEGIFFAEIAYLYKQNGIDIYNVLKKFYQKYRLSSYNRDDFTRLLDELYPGDFQPYFNRYIYGAQKR
jgi:hypothetical protein